MGKKPHSHFHRGWTRTQDTWPRSALEQWEVTIPNHHEGYITWEEFMRNQQQIRASAWIFSLIAFLLGTDWGWLNGCHRGTTTLTSAAIGEVLNRVCDVVI